jgi:hypothetical protein
MIHSGPRLVIVACAALATLVGNPPEAKAASVYLSLDPPGSVASQATALSGIAVVGYYNDGSMTRGFLYDGSGYTTINYPGSVTLPNQMQVPGTTLRGVSGNNIVGIYEDASLNFHGFLYDGSTYTPINVPGATYTETTGVSGNHVIGNSQPGNGHYSGFIYNGGAFTTVYVPGAFDTIASAISGHNVAGWWSTNGNGTGISAFLYDGSSYLTINPPGATYSAADGVSGNNVVGFYQTGGSNFHGFLYNGSGFTTLDVPGATSTQATGVSGNNVVGSFTDGTGTHGFLYDGSTYTTLDFPGATTTGAAAVDGNIVVGAYYDASGELHGFEYQAAAVPAPPSLTLLGIGTVVLLGYAWRRRNLPTA